MRYDSTKDTLEHIKRETKNYYMIDNPQLFGIFTWYLYSPLLLIKMGK